MHFRLLILFVLVSSIASAQSTELKKYWIELSDKVNSPYKIHKPHTFLSSKAIARRQQQGILITSSDLPVNPQYLNAIKKTGGKVYNTSKWLNAATVIADESTYLAIKALPFVKRTNYVGKYIDEKLHIPNRRRHRDISQPEKHLENYYGYAEPQITMINGHELHNMGYKGKGILIAVMDAGFSNVEIMPFFDSLRANKRLIYNHDFVDNDETVFESNRHGSEVLSVMAANLPGMMVGSAPDATYICIKTEDSRAEYLMEECNWIAGLEYADSLGVDIVNSSLGYTTFNDANMDYTYESLDGKTSKASIAADIAFQKGMIIVNAAGNEGNLEWRFIDVPADGFNVLAIGSITEFGDRADFSSMGPTPDGRIKPDLVALGKNIAIASTYNYRVNQANGTSFSCPLIAGMIASLWQAFPDKTNVQIVDAVKQSASHYYHPDHLVGYGLPDFMVAFGILMSQK